MVKSTCAVVGRSGQLQPQCKAEATQSERCIANSNRLASCIGSHSIDSHPALPA